MKSLTIQTWVSIIGIVIGVLGIVSNFLVANSFTPVAIATLIISVLMYILSRLINAEAVKLGLLKK